jgi:hypothetical protein
LYKANNLNDKNTKALLEKITKFAKERTIEKLTVSTDIYTIDNNFIAIHGIKDLDNAKGISQVLKEFKDYKIAEPAIIISSENYKVVQVKKNIEEYISGDWLNKPIVPIQRTIAVSESEKEPTTNKEEDVAPQKQEQDPNGSFEGEDAAPKGDNSSKKGMNLEEMPNKNLMPPTSDFPKKP